MELHIDLGCPQRSDDMQIPTPMDLQIDLDFFHKEKMIYENSHPHGTSN